MDKEILSPGDLTTLALIRKAEYNAIPYIDSSVSSAGYIIDDNVSSEMLFTVTSPVYDEATIDTSSTEEYKYTPTDFDRLMRGI